jgi:hypothetical protein
LNYGSNRGFGEKDYFLLGRQGRISQSSRTGAKM